MGERSSGIPDALRPGVYLSGKTALELLAQPVELRNPGPTPPTPFPTEPVPTPPDHTGYPDVGQPDQEYLYE